jgi:hypothetical protein
MGDNPEEGGKPMSRDKVLEPLEGIEEVQGRLAIWRQGRIAGQAMPEELWSAAADLAVRHSVYAVARSLGLEFSKLKKRLEQRHPELKKRLEQRLPKRREALRAGLEASGFLELGAEELFGEPAGPTEAVVEVLAPDGARMRISLRGRTAVDLPGLVSAFARRAERCCR